MKDNRSKSEIYYGAAKRLFMLNCLSKQLDLVLINEFPKSGGTWFGQMLSDATGIPFPRNRTPKLQRNLMHGHYRFHPRMNKAIAVVRDGRDVMVSAYFHFLFEGKGKNPHLVAWNQKKVGFTDYDNVVKNMPAFIEHMYLCYARKNTFHFSWTEFIFNINKYKDKICVVKYEELLDNPQKCLKRALQFYGLPVPETVALDKIVEKYSFANVTKRKQGEEDRGNFVRKGVSGDWQNYFNEEACELFKKYAGTALIEARYEQDMNWSNPKL